MSVAAVVRVRFLVALIIVIGVLASGAGAVAVERSKEVRDLRELVTAHDRVHRAAWPAEYRLTRTASGCEVSAETLCLVTDDAPAAAARTVAGLLGLQEAGTDRRTIGGTERHLLVGQVGEHPVQVMVQENLDTENEDTENRGTAEPEAGDRPAPVGTGVGTSVQIYLGTDDG